nr:GSK3-beta interaction protein-like isoform X1 [Pocillopora verrucosa]
MDDEEIDFKVEAEMVIADIGFAVEEMSISNKLPSSREYVYLNILTKEHRSICVELSVLGFRIVGEKFDDNQENSNSKYYETIYALLDSTSPGYTKSFGEALVRKLSSLQSPNSEDLEIPDEYADEAACS